MIDILLELIEQAKHGNQLKFSVGISVRESGCSVAYLIFDFAFAK